MDPMGGIVMTNDGNAILREITVQHPAAKTMIEIARTQDEEVGDGTTSVIVLAAEMLGVSHQFLEEKMHPTVVIQAYRQALEDAAVILRDNVATKIDLDDAVAVRKVIQSCVGTKFIAKWSDLACDIAMDAVKTVTMAVGEKKEIDIKRYAKVEKIPGGTIEDSSVLKGVMFNKDVTHPKMKRKNVNWGINGETGELADMSALGIWEPLSVKLQVFKTAIETAILLLRIDDIVSGSKKKGDVGAQGPAV